MSFESAWLTRIDGPIDVAVIEDHLGALPWAWRDPVDGRQFFLAGHVRDARAARDWRITHPTEYPTDGVLVAVHPDGVRIDQRGYPESMARARDFVGWLLRTGTWNARTELSTEQPLTSAEELYPGPLPSTSEMDDDPHQSPVIVGTLTRWTTGARTLSVHSDGAARLQLPGGGAVDARMTPEELVAWTRAADVDPEDLDFDASDAATRVTLERETPEGVKSAWLDTTRVPKAVAPLARQVARLSSALEGWTPGDPIPPGLMSITRREA
ncbi:hypothetical protein LZ198_17850 [Myxococcus sp. K15C18031901]|uniref:hypothetical protein n=1 Tax=Myxococcus dinghuensis TaxID=2906761 RepID=UPI0020A7CD84|nr:hypothetical protein [Myxococcus dinghuensis]MCP3100736.1 hypothetical protein [Myxococcus dinghuensis]